MRMNRFPRRLTALKIWVGKLWQRHYNLLIKYPEYKSIIIKGLVITDPYEKFDIKTRTMILASKNVKMTFDIETGVGRLYILTPTHAIVNPFTTTEHLELLINKFKYIGKYIRN